jgi:DNA (cytosine-5)-methyltransferase 1
MGFPDSFKIPVSDNQAYRQFGNAVVPPVVSAIGKQILKSLNQQQKTNFYKQLTLPLNL